MGAHRYFLNQAVLIKAVKYTEVWFSLDVNKNGWHLLLLRTVSVNRGNTFGIEGWTMLIRQHQF